MKTVSRKQAREAIDTIQSKGLGVSIGVGRIPGVTSKQRKFAEKIVIDGLNASQAYRESYNTQAKANTVNVNASKLAKNTKVMNTMDALERAKTASALHSLESLKSLVVSTLVDVATNSDKDSVRVQAVKTLGAVVGVDMFKETKRTESTQDSGEIREQILGQLKTMLLGTSDAVEVDAHDLLAELTNQADGDPTTHPPCQSDNGTPTLDEHTIPLEQSQSFLEDPPLPLDSSAPQGDIFSEDEDSYQDITVSSYSKQLTTK